MTPKTSVRIMTVLSVLFGLLVGLLGALDKPVAPTAIIGGVILGFLWVLRGVLINRKAGSDRAE